MIDFHLTGRIIDKITLKNKPLLFKSMACFQLYCLFTQYADHRGPQSREREKKQWSFPLLWNSQATLCLCVWFSPALPFPSSPSAVTEQTGQVINSGATTLNLSCRQGCFSLSLWCVPLCSSHAGISTNKAPQSCDGNLQDRFCVCLFVFMLLLRRDQLV